MRITTTLLALLFCSLLTAQITTDRLGLANSTQTMIKGSLQLECGLQLREFFGAEVSQLPSIGLRYGITDRLEASVSTVYEKVKFDEEVFNAPEDGFSGFGPTALGLKYDLGKSGNGKWKFALQAELGIDGRGTRFGEYNYAPSARLIVGQHISDRFLINHNLIYSKRSQHSKPSYTYAPQLLVKVNDATSLMFEPSITTGGGNSDPIYEYNAGLTHRIGNNVLLDMSIGTTPRFKGSQMSIGASILFNRD